MGLVGFKSNLKHKSENRFLTKRDFLNGFEKHSTYENSKRFCGHKIVLQESLKKLGFKSYENHSHVQL